MIRIEEDFMNTLVKIHCFLDSLSALPVLMLTSNKTNLMYQMMHRRNNNTIPAVLW
jgi:hypothetical protein